MVWKLQEKIAFGGAVHGGSSGGGGSSTTNTVQKADPWSGQQPSLKAGIGAADRMFFGAGAYDSNGALKSNAADYFGTGYYAPNYYPGETVADFSPETEAALQLQTQRALAGSPLIGQSQDQLTRTMAGDYLNANPVNQYLGTTADGSMLNGNPYREAMMTAAAGDITNAYNNAVNNVNARFSASGRYGSGAQQRAVANEQDTLASNLGKAATNIYYGDYQNERNNQINAANTIGSAYNNERNNQIRGMMFAPELAQADYMDIASLGEVGAAREGLTQSLINADVDRYNYEQQLPLNMLSAYMASVQGNYGGTTSNVSTAPTAGTNRVGNLLGGAAAGGGLGYMLGGSTGGLAGAGLGGLLGSFA